MKHPQLAAGATAIILTVSILLGLTKYAEFLEAQNVHRFSVGARWDKFAGSALSRVAQKTPELLTVIGASEALWSSGPYQSGRFFRDGSHGFSVFEIARPAATTLTSAQILAGLGSAVRDKNIIISYTPELFEQPQTTPHDYNGTFSLLHAHQILFTAPLGLTTKKSLRLLFLAIPTHLLNHHS